MQCIGDASSFIRLCRPYSQIVLGAGSGCLAGYILINILKLAAMAIGGGIILLQIVDHEGIIHVDWSKLQKSIGKISVQGPNKSTIDNASQMASSISHFIIAFIGGALIGIGCS